MRHLIAKIITKVIASAVAGAFSGAFSCVLLATTPALAQDTVQDKVQIKIYQDNKSATKTGNTIDLTDIGADIDAAVSDKKSVDNLGTETILLAEPIDGDKIDGDTDLLTPDTTPDAGDEATTPKSPRIGKRKLSNVGLVSIGLKDDNPSGKQLDSLIWQGSEAEQIAALMADTPAYGPSAEMNRLVLSAVLRQSVPPQGAPQMVEALVDARLAWLANAGRSDALAQLIRKLPDRQNWHSWKRWLVEYDLLRRSDDEACQNVTLIVSQTLEPFWHQAQVICHILAGNKMQASFTADVVQASGLADPQFMQLVDVFINQREAAVELDDGVLTPLHLILMDAAHMEVSASQISVLPVSLWQARSALRYLQRDAQLQVGFQALQLGLKDMDSTAELLRSLYAPDQTIIQAILQAEARIDAEVPDLDGQELNGSDLDGPDLDGQDLNAPALNALVRANLYTQLSGALAAGTEATDFDALLLEALRSEAKMEHAALLMPLYGQIISRRLRANDLPPVAPELLSDFAVWSVLAQPITASTIDAPIEGLAEINPTAAAYWQLLNLQNNDRWSPELLDAAGGWDWLGLLELRGVSAPDLDYTSAASRQDSQPLMTGQPVHPLRLLAIKQAVDSGRSGQAILLAAQALDGQNLAHIREADIVYILQALSTIGLEDSARLIAEETLRARMFDAYFQPSGE